MPNAIARGHEADLLPDGADASPTGWEHSIAPSTGMESPTTERGARKPSDLAHVVGSGLAAFKGIILPTDAQRTAVRQMDSLRIMGLQQKDGEQRRAYRYLNHSGAGKSTCAKILRDHVNAQLDRDPIHHLRDVVRRHGIQVRSSNYALYGDMQRRVIAACEPFARDFEIYSIDETFLDLSGFETRDLVAHANAMRAQVQLWTTIPTCVGIADTKTLAKLANAAAKKDPRFGGVRP